MSQRINFRKAIEKKADECHHAYIEAGMTVKNNPTKAKPGDHYQVGVLGGAEEAYREVLKLWDYCEKQSSIQIVPSLG